ncbi:uncharacterized protein A1O9_04262, partial [Exophiala aquamarina CBS 119918]
MNLDSALVDSPTTDEGKQSENLTLHEAPTVYPRPRQNSSARKRTNDEVYEPVQAPVPSPRSSRFQKSTMSISLSDALSQKPVASGSDGTLVSGQVVTTSLAENKPAPHNVLADQPPSDTPSDSFVQEITGYQQQLELEFQTFERSLEERDTTADLESLDWNDLEERYKREIQPHIDSEQAVMTEFGSRFQQFMLYMQVCNDQEAERAIKRLRTRISLAQNSEQSLAQKQEHRTKVLEAFQSAMALLGK